MIRPGTLGDREVFDHDVAIQPGMLIMGGVAIRARNVIGVIAVDRDGGGKHRRIVTSIVNFHGGGLNLLIFLDLPREADWVVRCMSVQSGKELHGKIAGAISAANSSLADRLASSSKEVRDRARMFLDLLESEGL